MTARNRPPRSPERPELAWAKGVAAGDREVGNAVTPVEEADPVQTTLVARSPSAGSLERFAELEQGTTSCWVHYKSLAGATRYRTRLDLHRPASARSATWTVIGVSLYRDDNTSPTATAGTPHPW